MVKKNVAIVAGGDQSEIVVSLKSADGLKTFISNEKYNLYVVLIEKNNWRVRLSDTSEIPIDKNDFSFTLDGSKITFDCVYNTIHGMPGEDGKLQGYLEMIGIPYTSSSVLASAVTFNKFFCNTYLKAFGIKSAESLMVRKGMEIVTEDILAKVGIPCFVKPNAGGSSFGVSKVKTAIDLNAAIHKAFDESDEVIVESFIKGTEVTNGIYKTAQREVVMPVTEVIPKNEFFDFEAKYKVGMAEEITPARISDDLTTRIQKLTSAIYDILGCRGIIRVDYIISENTVFLLEVNTTPGMTLTSFIPQQIRAMGVPLADVFDEIIFDAMARG